MTSWSTPESMRIRLRRRWDTGEFLTRRAAGLPFEPVDLAIRGPNATEIGARYSEVDNWVREWVRGSGWYSLRTKVIGGRRTGANAVPDRMRIDSFDDLAAFLGTTDEARRHAELVHAAQTCAPPLHQWVVGKPARALGHEAVFDRLLTCAQWIADNADRNRYLRQIDIPGVDTKFIERHKGVLREMVDLVVGSPANPAAPDLAERYGFRLKPTRIRIRVLDPGVAPWPAGISDVQLTVDELAAHPLPVDRVFLVENEVTFLAFPPTPRSLLIFGGGYAISRVSGLDWLSTTSLHYWGDIDTHGFRILDLMRSRFPHTRSLLMDRSTLLAHQAHWDREPSPVNANLAHLTGAEARLYRDLIEDVFGAGVRLEQERVRFSAVERAVMGVLDPDMVPHQDPKYPRSQ